MACICAFVSPARAEPGFKQRLIERVLQDRGVALHPEPEGKRIDRVDIVTVDVFTPADPIPDALNGLHMTTRPEVISRELLFAVGEPFESRSVQESARNLRRLVNLAVADILAVKVADPDAVGILVIVKDVWSLRLGFTDLLFIGDTLRLRGALTEMNLFGLHKGVALRFAHDPWVNEVGQSYIDGRLGGSRWTLVEAVDVVDDVDVGTQWRGSLQLARPFSTLNTPWSAALMAHHDQGRSRAQLGDGLATVVLASGQEVPYAYDREISVLGASLRRQWGSVGRQRAGIGFVSSRADYRPAEVLDGETSSAFLSAVALRPELANVVQLSWEWFSVDYRELSDLQTFAVTEDLRAGPWVDVDGSLSRRTLGSDEDYLALSVDVGHRWVWGVGPILSVATGVSGRNGDEGWVDRQFFGSARWVSASSSWGRINIASSAALRADNQTLGKQSLGGDTRLRGHPIGALRGDHALSANVEWRTASFHWRTYHVGGVVFWDAGSAWEDGDEFALAHGVGAGLRVFAPQGNRRIIRWDIAASPEDLGAFQSVFAFDQAF